MTAPTIVEFVTDPQFLGLGLSPAQETLLRAIYGALSPCPTRSSSSTASARAATRHPAGHLRSHRVPQHCYRISSNPENECGGLNCLERRSETTRFPVGPLARQRHALEGHF